MSPFKYSYHACLMISFTEDVKCDGSGGLASLCGGSDVGYAAKEDVIELLGAKGSVPFNCAMLFLISCVGRFAAYAALRRVKDGQGRQ